MSGCGQAEASKVADTKETVEAKETKEDKDTTENKDVAENMIQVSEESEETNEKAVQDADIKAEKETDAEKTEMVTEQKDISLKGEEIVVPGEDGYAYTLIINNKEEYDGEIIESEEKEEVSFDGTRYCKEFTEGYMQGSVEYCDITDGYFRYITIIDGDDMGFDTSSYDEFKEYEAIKEKNNIHFENLKDNIWEYVGEEEGTLIYSSTNGKCIHNDNYNEVDPSYIDEKYYDVKQTIYIDSETKELIKLNEQFKYDWVSYDYDDDMERITGSNIVVTSDYEEEYTISDIGTTMVEEPEGMSFD